MVFSRIDWILVGAMALCVGGGLLSLFSTSPDFFTKQLLWLGVGIVAFIACIVVDLRSFFGRKSFVVGVYLLMIIVLVLTYFFAPEIKGNRAWFVIGPFQFQPAEFAKVVLVMMLAYFFARRHIGIARSTTIISSFLYAAIPAGLVMLQPDLGSALVLLVLWGGLVLLSGLPVRHIVVGGLMGIVVLAIAWNFALQDYQKARIVGVFAPEQDPLGVNYSVIQSKIAIGSGGLFGKGFGQGTQVQLGFLPEAQNDFIVAAIAEEGGMFAVVMVLGAFVVMLFRILTIGIIAENNTLKFLSLGAVVMFLFQFVVNVGSVTGMLPVIGVTLPFVSYGGSSLLASFILVGVIQSLHARRM